MELGNFRRRHHLYIRLIGWAAITFGIGPHCSCYFMFCNGAISIILFTCPFLFITLIRWPRVEIIQVADALTNLLTFSHSCLDILSFGVVCITSTGALYSSFRTVYTNASVCAVFVSLTAKWLIYRVAQKLALFLYALNSSNINRFWKLFHCQNQQKICNNTITKDSTTPQLCQYTTEAGRRQVRSWSQTC